MLSKDDLNRGHVYFGAQARNVGKMSERAQRIGSSYNLDWHHRHNAELNTPENYY